MDIELTRGHPETLEEIVKKLEEEGYEEIFVWKDHPNSEYPWHAHPHDEVRWILEGSVLICTETEEITLKSGDRLDLKANTRHRATTGEEGVSYVCGSKIRRL